MKGKIKTEGHAEIKWQQLMLIIWLRIFQYLSPKRAAKIIWRHFTKPKPPRFKDVQVELINRAAISKLDYQGHELVAYKWGQSDQRLLLCHGWNSKIADFRRMINFFTANGYEVHGVDMKGHGRSPGQHTALPEFRDVISQYVKQSGAFDVVLGYSLGGIAAGVALSEIEVNDRPGELIIMAAPPYVRYIFKEVVDRLRCNRNTYEAMCDLMGETYGQDIDYFDLRKKTEALQGVNIHLIYDKDDTTVPYDRGLELRAAFNRGGWYETEKLGHYRILTGQNVYEYILSKIQASHLNENVTF